MNDARAMELWFQSLGLLRPFVSPADLRRLATETDIKGGDKWQCAIAHHMKKHDSSLLHVVLHPCLTEWYDNELAEGLLFIAAVAHLQLSQGLIWYEHRNLPTAEHRAFCRRIGVVCSDSASPSERWRLMGVQNVDYPTAAGDNFPCAICERHVNSDEPDPRVHLHCKQYAITVLKPKLKEHREAEKLLLAGDWD